MNPATHQSDETGLKTLYIAGQSQLRVLRDGPALRIRTPRSADCLFPLRRLRRIVVSGHVDWCTDALLACADAKIQISFLTGNGVLRARLLGPAPSSSLIALGDAFEMLLEQTDGFRTYQDWIQGCAQQARRRLLHESNHAYYTMRASELRRLLFERARRHARAPDLRRFDRRVYALLVAHLSQLLAESGLNCDNPVFALHGADLMRDFANILIWHFQIAKLQFLKRLFTRALRNGCALPSLPMTSAAGFYEERAAGVEVAFDRLIHRFHRYLLEVMDNHGEQ